MKDISLPHEGTLATLANAHPAVIARMVDSLKFLDENYPNRWQFSGYGPDQQWLGLFVGFYLTISVSPKSYGILVERDAAEVLVPGITDIWELKETRGGSRLARLGFNDEDAEVVCKRIGPAHELAISIAAKSGGGRRESHRADIWSSFALVASSLPVPRPKMSEAM